MADTDDLPPGLYERLITTSLRDRLAQVDSSRTRVETRALDPTDAHATLARHIEGVVSRALRGLPDRDRLDRPSEITNQVMALLISWSTPAASPRWRTR